MSIFVNEDDIFPIDVWIKEEKNESGVTTGIVVIDKNDSAMMDDEQLIRGYFCQPGADKLSSILEHSTIINSSNFKPLLSTKILRNMVLLHLMKKLCIVDINNDVEEETEIAINENTLSNMHWNVLNELFTRYMKTTHMDEVVEVALDHDNMG